MSRDLAQFIDAALPAAKLDATKSAAVRKKLIAVAMDPVLTSLPLDEARALRARHRDAFDSVLREMTLASLKKCLRTWDKEKKFGKDATFLEIRRHVEALMCGEIDRMTKASKAPAAAKPKKAAIAAE